MTKFNIAVTSDTVCPWCYVGKKKLEAGIAAYQAANPSSDDTFDVTWYPFQLNPAAPTPGVDKQQFYLEKFGDPERIRMMFDRLARIGEQCGIHFKFGGKTGNTRDSHRLIDLAKSKSPAMHTKVVEQLFASYFENEKDITDHKVLEEAGVNAGLPESEVKTLLASNERGPEIDQELQTAQRNLVTGVPNFVIQGKYEIQGAQDAEAFRRVFEKIKEMDSKM